MCDHEGSLCPGRSCRCVCDNCQAGPECLDGPEGCEGEVEFHSIDPGRLGAFPRCEKHWDERLDRRENSIEKYENSDVEPDWFDPAYAGERWSDDY